MTELEYDNFPQEVKAIVDTYDDNENLYEECRRIQKELEHIGWTCDYGLDGGVYGVRLKKYPFNEGDDYWTIENSEVVWSCWDDVSEELFDKNPNRKLFKSREEAVEFLTKS
tara:strand:+ start:170 stop:505 length:336 start_codon:yes stop_codon:yes gene_type:complete